jgi:hypothetical protein
MRITLVEKKEGQGKFQVSCQKQDEGTPSRPSTSHHRPLAIPVSRRGSSNRRSPYLETRPRHLTSSHRPPKHQNITTVASPLLQLPRELRESICLFALLNTPTPTSLVTTCQTLNMEAQPLLYHRPIKLSSQTKLFDWVNRSRPQNLKHVRNLSLQLTDVDMTLRASSERSNNQTQHQNPPRQQHQHPHHQAPSAWSLYEAELSNFDAALRSLPSLTEITIVPPRAMHSQLLRGMYLSLLALIPRVHPCLKLLVVHDDEASVLRAVKVLRNLPRVVFKDSLVVGRSCGGGGDVGGVKVKKASSPPVVVLRSPREKATRVKVEVEVEVES